MECELDETPPSNVPPPSFTEPTAVFYLRIMVNGPLSNDEVIESFPS